MLLWILANILQTLIITVLFIIAIYLFFVLNGYSYEKKHKQKRANNDSAYRSYFLQTKKDALSDNPNPEALWRYSVLLDQLSVEKYPDFFEENISNTEAKLQSQAFFEKALQTNSAAATVQTADTLIKSGIKNYEIVDITPIEQGLDILITVLKFHCRTEFVNSYRYPYYDNNNHQFKWNYGLVSQHRHSLLSHYKIEPRNVPNYPSLHNRLDVIDIRNKIHCINKQDSIYVIIRFLAGNQYTDDKVNWHTPLRHLIYLSVLAELLDKPNAVYLIEKQVVSEDKLAFEQLRQSLLLIYHHSFAKTVPDDNWQPNK